MMVWLLIGSLSVIFSVLFVIASWRDDKRHKIEEASQPKPVPEEPSTLPEGFVPFAQRLEAQRQEIKDTPKVRSPFEAEIPFGIKYARVLNSIGIFAGVIASVVIVVIILYSVGSPAAHPRLFLALPWAAGIISLVLGFAFFLHKLNDGLIHLESWAKSAQIILSILGLLSFPIGTIIWGICLYYMCFDQKTHEAFERGL